jgi:PIN domain nuclease of toxin-antitoxin system
MNILLDTCSFLWVVQEPEKISLPSKHAFEEPSNTVYLSSVTTWEIALKYSIGKLTLPIPPRIFIPEALAEHGIATLALAFNDTFHLQGLPSLHRDPFDRMLICQAIEHGLTILTPDEAIRRYPVKTLW